MEAVRNTEEERVEEIRRRILTLREDERVKKPTSELPVFALMPNECTRSYDGSDWQREWGRVHSPIPKGE